jgi:hypothetical protein
MKKLLITGIAEICFWASVGCSAVEPLKIRVQRAGAARTM